MERVLVFVLDNRDAFNVFRLEGAVILVIVRVLVKVGDGQEREIDAGVWGDVVDKFKRGGDFSVNLGQYLVGHSARVLKGV